MKMGNTYEIYDAEALLQKEVIAQTTVLRELYSVILAFFDDVVSTLPSIPISNRYPSTVRWQFH